MPCIKQVCASRCTRIQHASFAVRAALDVYGCSLKRGTLFLQSAKRLTVDPWLAAAHPTWLILLGHQHNTDIRAQYYSTAVLGTLSLFLYAFHNTSQCMKLCCKFALHNTRQCMKLCCKLYAAQH